MMHINWNVTRAKLKEAVLALPHFFKNPVQAMRTLPDWDWPTMLLLQGAFAAACAVIANLLERDILGMITGLIIAPISSIVVVAVGAGFFMYTFQFLFKRQVPYRQIYLHMIFAAIPIQITATASPIVPPLILVGIVAAAFLLFVGFVDVFHLERDKTKKLLGGMVLIYVLFWGIQLVSYSSKQERQRIKATPESLDILEKELKF